MQPLWFRTMFLCGHGLQYNNGTALRSASSLSTRHADAECVKSADYPQEGVCAVLQEWVLVKILSLCVWVCLHLYHEIAGCFLSFDPVRKVPSSGKCFTPWLSASQPQWFISVLWDLRGPFGSKYTLRSCLLYHCSYCASLVKEVLFYHKPTTNIIVWQNIPFQVCNIDRIRCIVNKKPILHPCPECSQTHSPFHDHYFF